MSQTTTERPPLARVSAGNAQADEILHGPTSEVTPISSKAFARMFEGYPG